IRRASPGIAVFCCGRGNPFGHPHPDVVQAWAETGAEILRTDLNGNIFLVTDGESMTFTKTLSR
ncbi:MAG TPA: MBL fold metallo-hydrolase, partial [Candidatus Sabulitectum sp.]|nr:MBL fold metallo-hydrolase [Candidatus Sabulitectum sp.]